MKDAVRLAVLIAILAIVCPAWGQDIAATPQTVSYSINVRDLGAKGDGATDDTAAFQNALDRCSKQGGGIVSVPAGKYMIKAHLNIPQSVTLEGTWRAPVACDKYHRVPNDPASGPELSGSVLLAVEGAGSEDDTPFISLNGNSCLKGMTIFYPNQTKTNPPVPYPWTVASAGVDTCSVIDVLMVNPYQAVDFGTRVAGRHYIRGLYAQAIRRGVFVDLCLDIGRLENIHLWPFWTAADPDSPVAKFTQEHGEAFIFGRADWEYVSNCFAISYNVGMRFVRSKLSGPFDGGGNYLLTQSGADCCNTAVLVEEVQGHSGISFSNSQIFGDIIVNDTNNGMVRFTGCGLFGSIHGRNRVGIAKIGGTGRVSFDNCHFYAIYRNFEADSLIHVNKGRVSITDSLFINYWDAPYNQTPIILERDVRAAVITGNEFYGKGKVVNRALGKVVIANNIEGSDTNPYPNYKPTRPKEEAGAIVLDDADGPPNVTFIGKWQSVPTMPDLAIGYYKGTHWAWKGTGDAKAVFKPNVPKTGLYTVYAYFGPDPASDHATNAPVEIRTAGGVNKTTVNLRGTKGEWIKLGAYRFEAGRRGTVTLSNNADGNVLADAVKLVPSK